MEVRTAPSWHRSWANSSLLYSHRNAWANLRLLGRPNAFLAGGAFWDRRGAPRGDWQRAGGHGRAGEEGISYGGIVYGKFA